MQKSNQNPNSVYKVIDKLKLKGDKAFVIAKLDRVPKHRWVELMQGYIQAWREGMDSEEVIFRKQNAGRFKANQYLLNKTDKR